MKAIAYENQITVHKNVWGQNEEVCNQIENNNQSLLCLKQSLGACRWERIATNGGHIENTTVLFVNNYNLHTYILKSFNKIAYFSYEISIAKISNFLW